MNQPPKIRPDLLAQFLQIVKDHYNGDVEAAFNQAIEIFVVYESQSENAKAMIGKINTLREKINGLRNLNRQNLDDISKTSERIKDHHTKRDQS